MHLLREAIEAGNLWLDLSEDQVEPIFEHVLDHLVDSDIISHENRRVILNELLANERQSNSALSDSVAIPPRLHRRTERADNLLCPFSSSYKFRCCGRCCHSVNILFVGAHKCRV